MYFLKYRPQTINELDCESAKNQLAKIFSQKNIPQGFLFTGPKGAGKTSAARIVAKAVNCLEPKNGEPCNKCDQCRQINNGRSLDVLEIDAASNRGIDDIRLLKEKIALSPVKAKYKVYIIDEAHMLTREAFNAFLKTLEEPPAHTIFILCTTDPEKIIPTVASRLIRVNFFKGNRKEIKTCLEKAISGEKIKIDNETLNEIIALSDGGFRDAQKILESLVLSAGNNVIWREAQIFLKREQSQKPEKILNFLAKNDLKSALALLENVADSGADFSQYTKNLLEFVHRLILAKTGTTSAEEENKEITTLLPLTKLIFLTKLIAVAAYEQKNTLVPQLPLQLAILEFLNESKNKEKILTDNKKDDPPPQKQTPIIPKTNDTISERISLQEVINKWEALLAAVKPMNNSVSAFLKAARPKNIDGNSLTLEVFYPFHYDRLQEEKNRKIVENGLLSVCGKKISVKCILGQKQNSPLKKPPQKEENNNTVADGDLYQIAKEIFGN